MRFLSLVFGLIALFGQASAVCGAVVVQFRMELTDAANQSISQIAVGQDFYLDTYVADVRNDPTGGVFAAYLDVDFQAALAAVDAVSPVSYGPIYQNVTRADFSLPGVMNDIGAVSSNGINGIDPIGVGENLVFRVKLTATAPGDVTFTGRTADNSPLFDVLVFNNNSVVDPSAIVFGGTAGTIAYGSAALSIVAVPEPSVLLPLLFGLGGCLTRRRRRHSAE